MLPKYIHSALSAGKPFVELGRKRKCRRKFKARFLISEMNKSTYKAFTPCHHILHIAILECLISRSQAEQTRTLAMAPPRMRKKT